MKQIARCQHWVGFHSVVPCLLYAFRLWLCFVGGLGWRLRCACTLRISGPATCLRWRNTRHRIQKPASEIIHSFRNKCDGPWTTYLRESVQPVTADVVINDCGGGLRDVYPLFARARDSRLRGNISVTMRPYVKHFESVWRFRRRHIDEKMAVRCAAAAVIHDSDAMLRMRMPHLALGFITNLSKPIFF